MKLAPPVGPPLRVTPNGKFAVARPLRKGTHHGLDFVAATGTPVRAVAMGVVDRTGFDKPVAQGGGGGGNYVVVRHQVGAELFESAYMHLSSIGVRKGDVLRVGDELGRAGATGTASGAAHLHFEWRRVVGGKFTRLDPTALFDLPSSSKPSPASPSKKKGSGLVAIVLVGAAAFAAWKVL